MAHQTGSPTRLEGAAPATETAGRRPDEDHDFAAVPAIDAVMGLVTPEVIRDRPAWSRELFSRMFGAGEDIKAGMSLDAHVAMMDEAGIAHAVLFALKAGPAWDALSDRMDPRHVIAAIERYPDRFSGLVGVDPTDGRASVRELERLVVEYGFVGAHAYPHWFATYPSDPVWYPIYAKCAELGVPIQIQVGNCLIYTPERRLRTVGEPHHIDVIACDFPELKIVAIHTGWPWVTEMVAVAQKHDNVWIGTDAYAPAYWHPDLVRYIGCEGRTKVVFGTDFPVIHPLRARREIARLGLDRDALAGLLYENANALYHVSDRIRAASDQVG